MIKDKFKNKITLTFLLLVFVFIPFSLTSTNDDIPARVIDESSVGFYQSTTCKISLFKFWQKTYQI